MTVIIVQLLLTGVTPSPLSVLVLGTLGCLLLYFFLSDLWLYPSLEHLSNHIHPLVLHLSLFTTSMNVLFGLALGLVLGSSSLRIHVHQTIFGCPSNLSYFVAHNGHIFHSSFSVIFIIHHPFKGISIFPLHFCICQYISISVLNYPKLLHVLPIVNSFLGHPA